MDNFLHKKIKNDVECSYPVTNKIAKHRDGYPPSFLQYRPFFNSPETATSPADHNVEASNDVVRIPYRKWQSLAITSS